jgi:glycosyltransferase involved in cell wall biosynthesis
MPRAKTLIVCGAGIVSGKEIMSLELGRGLTQRSYCASFITSFWNNGDFVDRLKQIGLPVYILPIGFISATLTWKCIRMTAEQAWRWPGLLWGYWRILRVVKPAKVIHTTWHHLLLLVPFLRPDRDLFWLHEFIPDRPQYRVVFRWFARRIGCFICVSDAVANSLRKIGIIEAKIRVVHNGLADPAGAEDGIREESERIRIGVVGQVGRWKGHDDLLEAFALVHSRHPKAELHVFGNGESAYRKELEQRVAKLKLATWIEWHDFVADRRLIYRNLDICVVPSRSHDPLPTTAIEASFFGLPAIATRRGGLPEILEHEVNGLLVEAEQPQQIAEAICRLIENPALRQSLATKARQTAIERFGQERFLKNFLSILQLE